MREWNLQYVKGNDIHTYVRGMIYILMLRGMICIPTYIIMLVKRDETHVKGTDIHIHT